jgi:hypothetical protein
MSEETTQEEAHCEKYAHKKWHGHHHCGKSTFGGVYGLAFVGAMVYYIQHSTTFWDGVLGILKALVWPALLIYKLLSIWHM